VSGVAVAVLVPMLNPNEPEAVLVERRVADGEAVAAGDVLCVLETSKSTEELEAEGAGHVVGWSAEPGDMVTAGDVLCYLAPSPDWSPPAPEVPPGGGDVDALPEGLRISQPALALARRHGLDLRRLPVGPLVTAAVVESVVSSGAAPADPAAPAVAPPSSSAPGATTATPGAAAPTAPTTADPADIVVYGGGGHGRTLIDLLAALGTYRVAGVVDRGLAAGESLSGPKVLGGDEALATVRASGVALATNGVGGIARVADRVDAFQRLAAAGFAFPALCHPSAVVEPTARIGDGAQVLAFAYVGSAAVVGFGCLVNTGAVVSHDSVLADYVSVSPGALLAGDVRVGAMTLVGMGVTVNLGVSIGERVRIGNGAVVKADVPDGRIVPAGSVWPPRPG